MMDGLIVWMSGDQYKRHTLSISSSFNPYRGYTESEQWNRRRKCYIYATTSQDRFSCKIVPNVRSPNPGICARTLRGDGHWNLSDIYVRPYYITPFQISSADNLPVYTESLAFKATCTWAVLNVTQVGWEHWYGQYGKLLSRTLWLQAR